MRVCMWPSGQANFSIASRGLQIFLASRVREVGRVVKATASRSVRAICKGSNPLPPTSP